MCGHYQEHSSGYSLQFTDKNCLVAVLFSAGSRKKAAFWTFASFSRYNAPLCYAGNWQRATPAVNQSAPQIAQSRRVCVTFSRQ
jgi:hypothetical protein